MPYIEVGANTSSTFQLPTKIMFSLKINFFKENLGFFFWKNKAHLFLTKYVQIEIFENSDWSMFLVKSSKKVLIKVPHFGLSPQNMNLKVTF